MDDRRVGAWQYLFSIAAVAMAVALGVLAAARLRAAFAAAAGRRGPLAGYLFFFGTLVPVLGFVNVFPFLFSYVADHFQYLASLGVIVPVASVLALSSARLARGAAARPCDGLSCDAGDADLESQRVFGDAETLYRDVIARNPQAWMAYQNLGTELASRNRLARPSTPTKERCAPGPISASPGTISCWRT